MNKETIDISTAGGRKYLYKFLDLLLCINDEEDYGMINDIHIFKDGDEINLEWERLYSDDGAQGFRFLDYDEVIMREFRFPDDHYEYLLPDEIEDRMKEWLKENPDWVKTPYDTWTNIEENNLCSIDFNAKKWNDTLDTIGTGFSSHNDFLEAAEQDDILRRTGCIIVGAKAAKVLLFTVDDEWKDSYAKRLGSITRTLTLKDSWRKEPEQVDFVFIIFFSSQVDEDCAILTTDEMYPLAKFQVAKVEEAE